MSKVEFDPNGGAEYISSAFTEILAGLGQLSPEIFAGRLLEKLIADGFVEMNPGCNKEQAAGMFAAAFRTVKLKIPS
jgi:hypothetical protein